ncbi:MBL fold metallo-hydrolase [Pengzhenrongella sicca]|uniref:MBL fold metallo-hydrolase n=1 Tax=Pengzhenrongella sicca TaxID=2819238 RepID=A0A8A4ZC18_9MICO|nr:MBL fold metallo-hydrolase [Pengzhenrongella sicca]QTE28423.1 MBL fold metallo-hydrolase [Pengzhenrongella sicca]
MTGRALTGHGLTGRALTEVAPGVWTATAEIWTSLTTVIVAADGSSLVVDPGISVAELRGLGREVVARGWAVAAGFATHPHWDHVLWDAALGESPRWATPSAVGYAREHRTHNLTESAGATPGLDESLLGLLTPLPDGAAEVPWTGPRAVVVPHEGHCPGHAGLVLPAAGVLLAGDMLSDLEVPLLDLRSADPIGDYRAGLDGLEAAAAEHGARVLVPGHGHVGDAAELARRLRVDRAYLDDLDADRPSPDPRLATDWIAVEHARHVAWRRAR